MREFDWTLIHSFLAVAEQGSYSAAARVTRHSQPTIGRHIQQLQSQLGAVLFQRSESGYRLTDTGIALMDHARSMQAAAARISLVSEGRAQDVTGTVRITASEIVATYLLPEILGRLLRQEPGLQLELVATNGTDNLMMREADIAVRMVQPEQLDLIARKCGEISLGLFVAQSYLKDRGSPQTLEDMQDHIILGYDSSDLIIKGMQALGYPATRHDFAYRIDDQVAYLEALKAGVGIGAAQVRLAQESGLVRVMEDIRIEPLPACLAGCASGIANIRARAPSV